MEKNNLLREERDKIVKGLEETYRKLVEYKKKMKSPMVILRNGKIEEVDPNDVLPTIFYKRKATL